MFALGRTFSAVAETIEEGETHVKEIFDQNGTGVERLQTVVAEKAFLADDGALPPGRA